MDKLKTLKDIPFDSLDLNRDESYKQQKIANFDPMIFYRNRLMQEVIRWIKKIRLAKDWRLHQLSGNSGSAMWRRRIPQPKESMDKEEIIFCLQFGGLCDDIPCNLLKYLFNIKESDLE